MDQIFFPRLAKAVGSGDILEPGVDSFDLSTAPAILSAKTLQVRPSALTSAADCLFQFHDVVPTRNRRCRRACVQDDRP